MKKKTVFYSDPLNDDFAATNGKIKKREVDEHYRYRHKGILYNLSEFAVYRCIATPLVLIYLRLVFGIRIKNRRAARKIKGGYFLYGNHTQNIADAFIPSLISFPKKSHIITSQETVSIPVVRFLTPMLGAVPLPTTVRGAVNFNSAIGDLLKRRRVITVYPEAHIWPFCNFIRPFRDDSFTYPVKHRLPVVPFVVTYRERRFLRFLYPLITVRVCEPVYPDSTLSPREARKKLRDGVYGEMCSAADASDNVGYIEYRQIEPEAGEDVPAEA
ncbi:phospholipid/glycerol acyltransferase [Candidatus Colimorpha enterica]|uniref:Phospholipid/glycerol acyltransferase n=1 Tax=Candidatus Colimorpha enterica TaxID=3083063 RepID=R6UU17_9BACT|nr:phospholipid/glycerol acyltransferase [Candidatus Colimorpha enterica]